MTTGDGPSLGQRTARGASFMLVARILGTVGAIAATAVMARFVTPEEFGLVAMVVAVRQALDYESTLRAVGVCAIGFPIYVGSVLLSVIVLGPWPG